LKQNKMAGSRRESVGTILTRMNGLLRAGAVKYEDRPIWYDVLKAKPPKPVPPPKEVQKIIYPEDFVRIHFYEKFADPGAANLTENGKETIPQTFISIYRDLHKKGDIEPDAMFEKAVEILKSENKAILMTHEERVAKKETQDSSSKQQIPARKVKVNVDTLFSDEK